MDADQFWRTVITAAVAPPLWAWIILQWQRYRGHKKNTVDDRWESPKQIGSPGQKRIAAPKRTARRML